MLLILKSCPSLSFSLSLSRLADANIIIRLVFKHAKIISVHVFIHDGHVRKCTCTCTCMSDACNSTRLSVRGVRMCNSRKMHMTKRERERKRESHMHASSIIVVFLYRYRCALLRHRGGNRLLLGGGDGLEAGATNSLCLPPPPPLSLSLSPSLPP